MNPAGSAYLCWCLGLSSPISTLNPECRLGVVADIGQTLNSSQTYQHLVADNPDVSPSANPCLHRACMPALQCSI